MKRIAIIPSGGKGKRVGNTTPKQYINVCGKEVIAYTLETFNSSPLIDEIIIPAEKKYFNLLKNIKTKYSLHKITKIIEGGNERQDSVFNALSSINTSASEDNLQIIIHDAARPLLSKEILARAIFESETSDNVAVALKSKDTLCYGFNNKIDSYVDRTNLFQIQTPQIFRYKTLMKSFDYAKKTNFNATDDTSIVKHFGKLVHIVEGSTLNFKITDKNDLELFKFIIENQNK